MKLTHSQRKKLNRKKQVKKAANIKKGKSHLIKGWQVKDAYHNPPIIFKPINGGKAYKDVSAEELERVAKQLGTSKENLVRRVLL